MPPEQSSDYGLYPLHFNTELWNFYLPKLKILNETLPILTHTYTHTNTRTHTTHTQTHTHKYTHRHTQQAYTATTDGNLLTYVIY